MFTIQSSPILGGSTTSIPIVQPNTGMIDSLAPPSPSLSTNSFNSWTNKSPNELIPMLKNAYSTIKDKEKDLRLAAEIGKSLLENNLALKSNYQDLLNGPLPTPSNSYSMLNQDTSEEEEEEYESTMQFVPAHRTREALVEFLEKQNLDLTQQLESVYENQQKIDRINARKSLQLETKVKILQSSLDHATLKIQELEEYRKKKTLPKVGYAGGSTATVNTFDETVYLKRFDESDSYRAGQYELLKIEFEHVSQSKAKVEEKLATSLQDLRNLEQQFEHFQLSVHDYHQLKTAFEEQQHHVQELESSLEEHQAIVADLHERGICISTSLFRSSVAISDNNDNSDTYSNDIEQHHMNRDSLLTELENAWTKHETTPPRSRKQSLNKLSAAVHPFQAIYDQLPNVDTAVESIFWKAGVVERDAIDDALSLIGRLENEYDHDKFLQEKRHIYYTEEFDQLSSVHSAAHSNKQEKIPHHVHSQTLIHEAPQAGLFGFFKRAAKSVLYKSWRCFRFSLVMVIAVFISARGKQKRL